MEEQILPTVSPPMKSSQIAIFVLIVLVAAFALGYLLRQQQGKAPAAPAVPVAR
jgi:hypothetical protein